VCSKQFDIPSVPRAQKEPPNLIFLQPPPSPHSTTIIIITVVILFPYNPLLPSSSCAQQTDCSLGAISFFLQLMLPGHTIRALPDNTHTFTFPPTTYSIITDTLLFAC
jgi:hypothetical protein